MRILQAVCILVATTFLCSCSPKEKTDIKTSPNEISIIDLCSQQYSYDELIAIANYNGDFCQYNSIYPIECIRQTGSVFRVGYLGKTHVAIVFFDQYGNKTLGRVFQFAPPLCEFDTVVGKSLSDVMNIDPAGDYTFLYTGRNDCQTSNHYTSDGYKVSLLYNLQLIVTDIYIEVI